MKRHAVAPLPPCEGGRSVPVPAATDLTTGSTDEREDDADDEQDDAQRPEDRDAGDETDDEQDDAEDDHDRLLTGWWCGVVSAAVQQVPLHHPQGRCGTP